MDPKTSPAGDPGREGADSLPSCEALFARFCLPWYSPADLQRRGHATTRPDVEVRAARPGTPSGRLHAAPREGLHFVRMALDETLARAVEAWSRDLGLAAPAGPGAATGAASEADGPTPDPAWLEAFDRAHDRAQVAALIAGADEGQRDNAYLTATARLGVVLGAVLRRAVPRAGWVLESPFWESAIYDPRSGTRVNVFHWALRRLSADAVDDDTRAKLLSCVEALEVEAARSREA
ncbi:MAG: hypothetical protein M9894_10195 [Planctomycetes bacterium]|nr:hypothetical protein [Planctomycetota bacterium]